MSRLTPSTALAAPLPRRPANRTATPAADSTGAAGASAEADTPAGAAASVAADASGDVGASAEADAPVEVGAAVGAGVPAEAVRSLLSVLMRSPPRDGP